MLRTAFLVGAAVLALGTACPARAQTLYHCVPEEPRAMAPDRLVSVEITLRLNGEFASVVYRAANGAAYDRGEQYETTNSQDATGQHYWGGTLRANPNVAMVGSFSRKGDRLVYFETILDKLQGGKAVSQVTSICQPIVAEAPPPRAPAPEPTSPPSPRERCEQYYGKAECDHAVAPQPSSAYAPTPQSTTPTSPAEDALLLYPASEGRALYTYIDIGPWPQRMLVDTGSTGLTVNESLAQRLLARGLAHEGPQGIATLADGSQREQQSVIIDTVTIGSHVLHDVLAGVSPDGSPCC